MSPRREVTGVTDLEAATREAVLDVAGRVSGTVGVVVPVARRSEANAWLASWPELADDAAGARAAIDSSVAPSGEDRIVVLTGLDTKGLEFDGIVVVRPDEIEAESVTGRATLYVALTRATQLLTTVSRRRCSACRVRASQGAGARSSASDGAAGGCWRAKQFRHGLAHRTGSRTGGMCATARCAPRPRCSPRSS